MTTSVTHELNPDCWRPLVPSPLLCSVCSTSRSSFQKLLQNKNVLLSLSERAPDCPWLRPMYKLRFLVSACRGLFTLQPLNTSLYIIFLAYESCYLPIWTGLPLSSVSSYPLLIWEASFQLPYTWEVPGQGCSPTYTTLNLGRSKMMNIGRK